MKKVGTSLKSGFTLIELIMVVAIIALIATLAINKLSGVKNDAAKKLSYANIERISTGLDAFAVAGNNFNAFDSLIDYPAQIKQSPDGDYLVSTNYFATGTATENQNIGLAEDLRRQLCLYYLGTNDITALKNIGMTKTYLALNSRASVGGNYDEYGAMMVGVANSPLMCNCYGKKIVVGMGVAMVNPFSPLETIQDAYGYELYRQFGTDIRMKDGNSAFLLGGKECTSFKEVYDILMAQGGDGILLAFGIGENASVVGNANAGIESSPVCPLVRKDEYPRYVALFRLRTVRIHNSMPVRELTYAGVIDSYGQTAAQAKETF